MSKQSDVRVHSRRHLLQGAGAGVLGLGAGAVAWASGSGGRWDDRYEVVVIGAGGAGLAAAVKAAQAGAQRVVVLEKLSEPGGNTLTSQGFFNAADPKRQSSQHIKDSPRQHMMQTFLAGDKRGDLERIRVLCDNAYASITWLESLGMRFQDRVIECSGGLYPRAHMPVLPRGQGYIQTLLAACEYYGVAVVTDMRLRAIVRQGDCEGPVKGVVAEDMFGNRWRVRASRGVVLAAGGFGANRHLRELHDPRAKGIGTTNSVGAQGEVAMAAVRVGGYLVGMDFIQYAPGAPNGRRMELFLNFNVNGSIYVDRRAKRIINEGERREAICRAVMNTPERYVYTICDDETFRSYDETNQAAILKGIDVGEAWSAPTIGELAFKMGVDPVVLSATVADYNRAVQKGHDEQFLKSPHNLTKAIDQGPFWACYTGINVHHTMGGLNTNSRAQCLDWKGEVIERLYAAGEIVGGIHGTNRIGGNGLLDCMVFGQIAGENVAREPIA